jgi:phosphate uptake regulator
LKQDNTERAAAEEVDEVELEEEEEGNARQADEGNSRSFERMLQKSGRGSIALVLPHSWIDQTGLKIHDRIFLKWQQDGSLRVAPLKQSEREHWVFVIDANQTALVHGLGRGLISAYIEGFNKMKVTSSGGLSKEQYDDVIAHASKLIGLAVIGDSLNSLVIKCYLDPFKNDTSQLFVRMYSLSSVMLKDSLDALIGFDQDSAHRVAKLDSEVDKIYYLILRQLFTAARDPIIAEALRIARPLNIVSDRTLAHLIEDIGDACHNSCTKLLKYSRLGTVKVLPPMTPDLEQRAFKLKDTVCSLYDRAFRAYSLSDRQAANMVIEDSRHFEKAVDDFDSSIVDSEKPQSILSYALVSELALVGRHCRSMGEIAFNRAIGVDKEDLLCEGFGIEEES